jgi:hypothetical protein
MSVIISFTFKLVSVTISTTDLLSISSVLIHIGYDLPVITLTEPLKFFYTTVVSILETDDCVAIYSHLKSSNSIDFFNQVKIIKTVQVFFCLFYILIIILGQDVIKSLLDANGNIYMKYTQPDETWST